MDPPPPPPDAPPLDDLLHAVLRAQGSDFIDVATKRQLRLVNKATQAIVNDHMTLASVYANLDPAPHADFSTFIDAYPWLPLLESLTVRRHQYEPSALVLERLAALPLPRLCRLALLGLPWPETPRLARIAWPRLTALALELPYDHYTDVEEQFSSKKLGSFFGGGAPSWALEKLTLRIPHDHYTDTLRRELDMSLSFSSALSFFPKLRALSIGTCTNRQSAKGIAQMADLPCLEELEVFCAYEGLVDAVFQGYDQFRHHSGAISAELALGRWPRLIAAKLHQCLLSSPPEMAEFCATASWLHRLKILHLDGCGVSLAAAETFFEALQGGPLVELRLTEMGCPVDILPAFQRAHLPRLRDLRIQRWLAGSNEGMAALLTAARLPALTALEVSVAPTRRFEWNSPPFLLEPNALKKESPLLQRLKLDLSLITQPCMRYLAATVCRPGRRCEFDGGRGRIELRDFDKEERKLIRKLALRVAEVDDQLQRDGLFEQARWLGTASREAVTNSILALHAAGKSQSGSSGSSSGSGGGRVWSMLKSKLSLT